MAKQKLHDETLTDSSPMPYGKYKDIKMVDIPPSYLLYLYDNNKAFNNVKDYIVDNLDILRQQAGWK